MSKSKKGKKVSKSFREFRTYLYDNDDLEFFTDRDKKRKQKKVFTEKTSKKYRNLKKNVLSGNYDDE